VIDARQLTKTYGPRTAVDELSFRVHPGCVTGFLGPNGAGKSTTMRMILDLDRPTRGQVRIAGQRYADLRWPLREVGALLDPTAVPAGRTAYHHLVALARSNRIPVARVSEVLGMVGLEGVAGQRIRGFSLGMKQRLGIAAALVGDPALLMFDEPVNGLDPEGIRWLRTLLRDLAGEGRAVFVSSHLINEISLIAQRLVVIGRGRLIAEGSTEEVIGHAGPARVYVVAPQAGTLARLLTAHGATVRADRDGSLWVAGLDAAGVGDLAAAHRLAVHELRPATASLEDAFLDLTTSSVEYHGTESHR
jgi:ABC-2 type transport system ATP-binding protein